MYGHMLWRIIENCYCFLENYCELLLFWNCLVIGRTVAVVSFTYRILGSSIYLVLSSLLKVLKSLFFFILCGIVLIMESLRVRSMFTPVNPVGNSNFFFAEDVNQNVEKYVLIFAVFLNPNCFLSEQCYFSEKLHTHLHWGVQRGLLLWGEGFGEATG